MPFELRTDSTDDFLEVVYSGEISGVELHMASRAAAASLNDSGLLRAMADLTGVARVTASAAPVLELPQSLYVDAKLNQQLRIAVLVPPIEAIIELARFYELACQNRGWQAKTFSDRGAAVNWLKGNASR